MGCHANEYTAPELITTHLSGKLEDYKYVMTSPVLYKTEDGRIVTKSGTIYTLGEVNPDYEKSFPSAKERLIDSLEIEQQK